MAQISSINPRSGSNQNASPSTVTASSGKRGVKPAQQNKEGNRREIVDRRENVSGNAAAPNLERRMQGERRGAVDTPSKSGELEHEFATQKRLLASCEKVNLLEYRSLLLEGYPDEWQIDQAKKNRDILLFTASVAFTIFILGVFGVIHSVIAGLAAGVSLIFGFLSFSPLQTIFTQHPSLIELLAHRRRLMNDALAHVKMLEDGGGLAWRCNGLADYNTQLYANQYSGIVKLSKASLLTRNLTQKHHFRLYLQYMIEAQKAYKTLQQIYLSNQSLTSEDSP